MKQIFLFFIITSFIIAGCKKDSNESFYQKADGIWAPYQMKFSDGRIEQSSLVLNSLFGAYDESVMLNDDLTFLPGSTSSNNTFTSDTLEKGEYTYSEVEKKLSFKNSHEWVYKVVHFDSKELWLSSFDSDAVIYYFRRQ